MIVTVAAWHAVLLDSGDTLYLTGHDHRRDDPENGPADGLGAAAAIGLRPHAAADRNRLILIVAGVSSCLSRDRYSSFTTGFQY